MNSETLNERRQAEEPPFWEDLPTPVVLLGVVVAVVAPLVAALLLAI